MAATRTRAKQSTNGRSATGAVVKDAGAAVKDAGDTAAAAARRARVPLLAAGAAAAGLAGGLAAGSHRGSKRHGLGALVTPRRRRLLGMPLGRKSAGLRAAELLRESVKQLDSATSQVSGAADDVREIREQLDRVNRQSPLEVVLDGLTHRRGAHRREG